MICVLQVSLGSAAGEGDVVGVENILTPQDADKPARVVARHNRRATRKKYTAEEKVRIVLEGFGGRVRSPRCAE